MADNDYQVFARRFRPTTFEEVVGQEAVATTLANAVSRGRTAHAYLFAGPRGVGKTSVARILAKALNCVQGPTVTPCGECDNCRAIAAGNDTDVLEIDGASNSSVDDIRKLWETIRYAPGHSLYKVYIIDEVHSISGQAFNALLKTLEEPPSHTVFVFATTRLDKVPDTIASRCQRFVFQRIGTAAIEGKLARIAREENLDIEPAALALVARRAGGSMRDAESLFDQVIAFGGAAVTRKDVERTLGLVAGEAVETLMAAILTGDGAAALAAVDELSREGADLTQAANQAVEYLRNLMVLAAAPGAPELVDLSGEELAKLREQASRQSAAVILNLITVFLDATGPLARVFSPRLVLEYAALKAARIRSLLPVEELIRGGGNVVSTAAPPSPAPAPRAAAQAMPTPAAPAAEKEEPPAAAASPVEPHSLLDSWRRVVDGLARSDRALHALVSTARPIALAGGELRLGFAPSYRASANRVNEPGRRAALGLAISKILGEAIAVKAEVEEGATAAAQSENPLFGDMPAVSQVRDRFQGEIVDENEINAPEKES